MLIDDYKSIPEMFTDGFRGVMLIKRNKDGEDGNAQRKAVKRITSSTGVWRKAICELQDKQKSTHEGYRIYASVNERSMSKAIHEFERRQLEARYGNLYEYNMFYTDIQNRFFSCLMNPNSREQNSFLIDCDSPEEYEFAKLQLRDTGLILWDYATKNGRHLITNPFNPNDFGNMAIKKDDLMYIG